MVRESFAHAGDMSALATLRASSAQVVSALRRRTPRVVPAAVVPGYELIHLGGGEMLPSPGVESLPLDHAARTLGLGSTSLSLPPAKVHVFRDAVVCPGARIVRDSRHRIIAESLAADMSGRVDLGDQALRRPPIEVEGTVALFRSPWRPHFHTLIDHLPRAALLGQPAMRHLGPITLLHDGELNGFEQLLLPGLVGRSVHLREVDPDRAVHAERVLLPAYVTRPGAGAIPSWYRRWIDRAVTTIPVVDEERVLPRRIFVNRTRGDRKVTNPGELGEVLDAYDVQSVDLQSLTPAEQIRCFRDADLVIGVTGSGLANALFSRDARIVELVPGRELLPHFFYLCASKGLPYDFVLAPSDNLRMAAERRLQHDVAVDIEALVGVLATIPFASTAAPAR